MNSVNFINAYLAGPGFWVFDDARFGLVAEAFVGGASEAIERVLARKFPGQKLDRCRIIFSEVPLPDADLIATVGEGEDRLTATRTGAMYYPVDGSERFWLCPALCHYFGTIAPERIHATFQL